MLGEKRRRGAGQVRPATEDKGWYIKISGSCCRDGQPWGIHVTGFGEGSSNMLRSREYETLGSFPGLQEVMDRMDGDPKGEDTENEHEAKRCRSAPAP